MSYQENDTHQKEPTFLLSIIVILLITVTVSAATLYYKTDVHAPIVMLAVIIGMIGRFHLKISYSRLENAALSGIMSAMQSCMILMLVGMLVGVWMLGGVIPGLIYYGLSILNPSIFPLATLLICSIISLSTGSSWSTMATIGVAMMGIGNGLGVPAPLTAGIVVSGAYFGDKMSPLSDTTNLAPAVSGGEIFDHIRAMLWTTGPAYFICCVILIVWGFQFSGGVLDATRISAIQAVIRTEFPVSLACVVPPMLVIAMSIKKFPAIPGICVGIFAGMLMCFFYGATWGDLWTVTQWGYKSKLSAQIAGADVAAIAEILKTNAMSMTPELAKDVSTMVARLVGRGGMQPMMWSVSLAIAAMAMGGFLEVCGILSVLLNSLTRSISKVGGLIAATSAACFISNLLTGSQYLSIIIPGRMFKAKFEEYKLSPRMLSRTLEDTGTLTSVLVPWNVCGGYAAGVLGVSTLVYAPYAILNWLNPLIAIAITYAGIGIFRRDKNGVDHLDKDTRLVKK